MKTEKPKPNTFIIRYVPIVANHFLVDLLWRGLPHRWWTLCLAMIYRVDRTLGH